MTTVMTHSRGVHEIGPAVIALGVFDGVHVGHQTLVRDTIELARTRRVASCVLTFDRDPDQVVTPDRAAPQLTTFEDKIALLRAIGPDAILVVPFDEWLASLTPADFCIDVLLDASEPVACMVGYDFRFGVRASGSAQTLHDLGDLHGFDVVTHPLVNVCGEPVTSTRIRALVASGRVAEASGLLGRPHRLRGEVVRGRGAGRALGTPTANIDVDSRFALPAPGVYAARASVLGSTYAAAVSVGVPPTFPEATCLLEAHLLDFSGDLYGEQPLVEFVERIRDQAAFDSPEALAPAIRADVDAVRRLVPAPFVE
jgi:riboflavin kinase/FMN adenylyltransferase